MGFDLLTTFSEAQIFPEQILVVGGQGSAEDFWENILKTRKSSQEWGQGGESWVPWRGEGFWGKSQSFWGAGTSNSPHKKLNPHGVTPALFFLLLQNSSLSTILNSIHN